MSFLAHILSLETVERHPLRVMAVVGAVFALAYVAAVTMFPRSDGRIIRGDTIQYYAYLRSLVIDHDLDFTNDYKLLYPAGDDDAASNVWLTAKTARDRPPNMMSIGPALLWAPSFLATYAALLLLRPLGIVLPLDGMAAPFPLSAGIAGILYATIGVYLCYRSCRLLFDHGSSVWASLTAWLATPAVYYSLVSPAYSHAPSLFTSALFCYVWLRTRGDNRLRRYFWLGMLGGLAALVRWQDVVVLALPMAEIGRSVAGEHDRIAASLRRAAVMVCAVIIMISPQLFAWRAIYGELLVMPQGGGFMQWTTPAVVAVLFSLQHGLFSWTPAVLVAVIGLYYLVRRDTMVGWSAVVVVMLAVYINASANDWWAGEAFGARRFVGYTVFFAWGLAGFFATDFWQARPVLRRWTSVALVAYNLLFLLQYQVFMRGYEELVPYPSTIRQVLFDRLTLPWHLLRAWLDGS